MENRVLIERMEELITSVDLLTCKVDSIVGHFEKEYQDEKDERERRRTEVEYVIEEGHRRDRLKLEQIERQRMEPLKATSWWNEFCATHFKIK